MTRLSILILSDIAPTISSHVGSSNKSFRLSEWHCCNPRVPIPQLTRCHGADCSFQPMGKLTIASFSLILCMFRLHPPPPLHQLSALSFRILLHCINPLRSPRYSSNDRKSCLQFAQVRVADQISRHDQGFCPLRHLMLIGSL